MDKARQVIAVTAQAAETTKLLARYEDDRKALLPKEPSKASERLQELVTAAETVRSYLRYFASDTFSRRIVQSYHLHRSGDLEVVLNPFWIRQKAGTTHGTPYPYDSHIPLIFLGNRIRAGRYSQHVAMNDVAPTLATRFGVALPSGSVGNVLSEVLPSATAASGR